MRFINIFIIFSACVFLNICGSTLQAQDFKEKPDQILDSTTDSCFSYKEQAKELEKQIKAHEAQILRHQRYVEVLKVAIELKCGKE
jgi:hypothetical protein